MLEPKTHYEQVPLAMVSKMVEQQMRLKAAAEEDQETGEKTLEEDPLEALEQSGVRWRSFSKAEA
jgi:hypothetical protein